MRDILRAIIDGIREAFFPSAQSISVVKIGPIKAITFSRWPTQAEVEMVGAVWAEAYEAGLKAGMEQVMALQCQRSEAGEPEYFH